VNEHKPVRPQASRWLNKDPPRSRAPGAFTRLVAALVCETKACCTSAPIADLSVPEVIAWAW